MNFHKKQTAENEEFVRESFKSVPMNDDDIKRISEFDESPEQVVVECEMIWLQVNE